MSQRTHSGTHPEAELLSAFAEQALNARERGEVLEHLATCGRCRQVVALASHGAVVQVKAAARVRPWWRSWGVALAPITAIAAATVIAVYAHERSTARDAEVARVEEQQADRRAPAASPAPPQIPVENAPRAAAPPAARPASPAETRKKRQADDEPREPATVQDQPAAAPPAIRMSGLLSAHREPDQDPGSDRPRSDDDGAAPPKSAPESPRSAEVTAYNDEIKRRAEERLDRQLVTETAPKPGGDQGPENRAAGKLPAENAVPGGTSTAQLQAPVGGPVHLYGLSAMENLERRSRAVSLPDKKVAVSVASAGGRMVAIDERGSLFVSEDAGETWQRVEQQWTGLALLVRRHSDAMSGSAALHGQEAARVAPDSDRVSEHDTVFELVNDQGQVWVSADGQTWTAK